MENIDIINEYLMEWDNVIIIYLDFFRGISYGISLSFTSENKNWKIKKIFLKNWQYRKDFLMKLIDLKRW